MDPGLLLGDNMPCYKPLSAWQQPVSGSAGKRSIVFSREHLENYDIARSLDLPCGQCIGCRLERSRRWAVRIMHEAQMHERNSFLTLTYDDDHLPSDGSLQLEDFQLFMKRLRRGSSGPLRFFHCGEYGESTGRPHYHACLFGEDFVEDRVVYRVSSRGDSLYNSERLTETWGLGHAVIGELTFESAAYVARYCLKKVTGEKAEAHYAGRTPEYVTMSRRPGIGAGWYERFRSEVFPADSVVMRGQEMLPPPFYDKLLEKTDPELFEKIKLERVKNAGEFYDNPDNYTERLMVRRAVKDATVKNALKRSSV